MPVDHSYQIHKPLLEPDVGVWWFHLTRMKELLPEADQLRSSNVGIMKKGAVSHIAPKYTFVPIESIIKKRRKSYLQFHKTISTTTASRDLSFAAQKKLLTKTGTKALTLYDFT